MTARSTSGDGWRIACIELVEPARPSWPTSTAVGRGRSAGPIVLCLDRHNNATYKGVVSLTDDRVESFDHVPGVQANFTVDEFEECDEVLRAHPDVIAALAKRGITDMDMVFMDTWTYGDAVAPPEYHDRRIGWSDTWIKNGAGANPYAHPVSGLHCVIDLNTMELLRIEDNGGVTKPNVMGEYVPKHIPERIRAASRPRTAQTAGHHPVRGAVVHRRRQPAAVAELVPARRVQPPRGHDPAPVRYRDGDRARSIAHRISFAEMIVPYRDSSEDHYRRTAFDIGEWGLGFMTTSLELGCDCLGEIRYLDAVLHNSKGEPYTITNAICIHEEDNAVLWKHVDHDAGAEVRRMRRLTLSFHVTVANYEYLVYWRFYQDGNIECEVRATGIMVTTPFAEGQPHPNGTLVDERTYAPFHQHFLVARLDLDVDGTDNTVYMRSPMPSRSARTTRTDCRWCSATSRCAPRAKASRTSTSPPSGRGRWSTPTSSTGSAPTRPTSWCPAARSRRCSTRRPRCSSAPTSSGTRCG